MPRSPLSSWTILLLNLVALMLHLLLYNDGKGLDSARQRGDGDADKVCPPVLQQQQQQPRQQQRLQEPSDAWIDDWDG